MHEDLIFALNLLNESNYTCVLRRDDITLTDERRGIRPLMELLESGQDFSQFCAADRVVGKAAAFLYCVLGIRAVYARVISVPALEVLLHHGVETYFDTQVPAIRNRTGDGFCPMETAVWDLFDPADAPDAIREALSKL